VKPGLSSFAKKSDYSGARQKIEDLIGFANQFVPQERRAGTPIMLKATAGLRAVPAEQAQGVLKEVRAGLAESGYKFREEWADIIKGKEEGGLAWLAANYLKGTFVDEGGAQKPSIGVIEMGGGSTQVTFEVASSTPLEPSDDFSFTTARGRSYRVYAHSYLGFGQDYAQNQLLTQMPQSELEDPCYPSGYVRKGPIRGTGQAQSCKANLVQRVVGASEEAPGVYKAEIPLRGNFVATENFFYVQNDLSMKLEELARLESSTLDSAGEQACSKAINLSADEIAKMESGEASATDPKQCFGLVFQAVLLQSLRAFTSPDVSVQIAHQINGGDVDWALGAALVHYLDGNVGVSPGREPLDSIFWYLGPPLLLVLAACLLYRMLKAPLFRRLKTSQVGVKPSKIGASNGPIE